MISMLMIPVNILFVLLGLPSLVALPGIEPGFSD